MTICICGGIALSIVYFAIAVLMVVLLERTGLSFLGWGVQFDLRKCRLLEFVLEKGGFSMN